MFSSYRGPLKALSSALPWSSLDEIHTENVSRPWGRSHVVEEEITIIYDIYKYIYILEAQPSSNSNAH